MKILIVCEESQVVTKAFRKLGHRAYSNDLQNCSGDHPEWHVIGDVFELLDSYPDKYFDIIIGHPPCTAICVTGNSTYSAGKQKYNERKKAILWVDKLWLSCLKKADKVCFENPVGVLSTMSNLGKPSQYIQPYEYGHTDSKKTGLWLYNLDLLQPTKIIEPEWIIDKTSHKRYSKAHWYNGGNGKARAKTYPGIAKAMAQQWG